MKLLVLTSALLVVCLAAPDKNLVELATQLKLTKFVEYVTKASLKAEFEMADKKYTIFAPTDEAFAALPDATKNDNALLKNALQYHVVSGTIKAADLVNDAQQNTLNTGNKIRTNIYMNGDTKIVTINGVKVDTADQEATNGMIHVLGKLLVVPEFNSAVAAVATDAAFAKLKAALTKAGLGTELEGDGPYTIFAPNDAAFAKLTDFDQWNDTEVKRILKNHIVEGTYYSAGLLDGLELENLGENAIKVKISGSDVTLNEEGKVINKDKNLKNGVLHTIDTVLTKIVKPTPTSAAMQNMTSLTALFVTLLALAYLRY